MIEIGVQTHNIIDDNNPEEGFTRIAEAGFACCDFSLNMYLKNKDIYNGRKSDFFEKSIDELETFFRPHKDAAKNNGIRINQMHMPYPIYVPKAEKEFNEYLIKTMATKSMEIGRFLECQNIVIHGTKMSKFVGSEEAEWTVTEKFLDMLVPLAKKYNMIMCIENLYDAVGKHLVEGPCCNARKAAERIDQFNEKHGAEVLGFCFDTGHANLVGIDFEDFILSLGNRLKVLHIHDNDGIRDLHQMPYTFTMDRENNPSTDWNSFLSGLREIGFDGVLSFETAPVLQSFPCELKLDALKMISNIGHYFASKLQ